MSAADRAWYEHACLSAFFLFLMVTLPFSSASAGPAEDATAFLLAQQHTDGAFATPTDIATTEQATMEVLATLELSATAHEAGVAFLGRQPLAEQPTEYLARLLMVADPLPAAVTELLARQNPDGGFGAYVGAPSNVLDTTWGLTALEAAGFADGPEAQRAVGYLLSARNGDVWSNTTNAMDVALSLRAWHALFPYRHTQSGVTDALDSALAEIGATALEEDFLEAQRLIAVLLRAPDATAYAAAVQAFKYRQLPDGSWAGDVYTTALALQLLKLANDPYPNPDLASLHGRVIDAEYGTSLAGVTILLDNGIQATTDAAGNFFIGGLPAGSTGFEIQIDGYAPLTANLQLLPGQDIDLGDLGLLSGSGTSSALLRGSVRDTVSGSLLAGVHLALQGSSVSVTTDETGQFTFTVPAAGDAVLAVTRTGYESKSLSLSLTAGETELVSIMLSPEGSGRFTVQGRITDGETDTGLAGATIRIGGSASGTAVTDSIGNYRITDLATGSITLEISKSGYRAVIATTQASNGQILNFSPALYPEGSSQDPVQHSGLMGVISNVVTGSPLAGASVTLTSDTETLSAVTGADGRFTLSAKPGIYEAQFSLTGYRASKQTLNIVENITLDIGNIKLSPEGYYPEITVAGIVLDSATNEPLRAEVSIIYDDGQTGGSSAVDGNFAVIADGDRAALIQVTAAGYLPLQWKTVLPDKSLDLGQLRLRPEGLDALRADITLTLDDVSERNTSPATLEVTGKVRLKVANIGRRDVETPFSVVAFQDTDDDGSYTAGSDPELGRADYSGVIGANGNSLVELQLQGKLPFRDAPIHFAADPSGHIIELRDDNNVTGTFDACRIRPERGTFIPVEKWRWTGYYVTSTPMVAPLQDTNGDSMVDENDDPFVVFVASYGFPDNAKGFVVALNGRTGKEAWRYTAPSVRAASQVAIGDVDADGYPEVLALRYWSGMLALNGDGSLKWSSDYPDLSVSYSYGGPSIADLDHDGYAEIIALKSILNHDGSLHARITAENIIGKISAVADVNLDGNPEILIGANAFDSNGQLLWTAGGDGRVAVADFDNDNYPEIVWVGGGYIRMLSHTGEVIWGPVRVSRRFGGSPTIGDVGGDGIPEIGVASDSHYWLFNADGSVRWSASVYDGSEQTGSTFFDFDGDNRVEAVYFDERYLRVFDGNTGEVLFTVPNRSVTALEYPTVADIDNDSHAELLVPSYDRRAGVRAFEDVNDSWVDVRNIWNQYDYHITNVNDDGSVPINEKNSWEVYNNYRVNAVPDPTRVADLTASLFQLQDNGPGNPLTATLRVGNGGGRDAKNVSVRVYTADPAAGGSLWAEIVVPTVPAGDFVDVSLQGANLPANPLALHAVVNDDGAVDECFLHNNSMTLPEIPIAGLVSVATDAAVYAPEQPVLFSIVAENTGSFMRAFELRLRVEDNGGNTVAEFAPRVLGELSSGEQRMAAEAWNTGRFLAGNYSVHAKLYAVGGKLLDEALAPFAIVHDAQSVSLASLRLATDRVRYHTTDEVRFDLLATNESLSTLLAASSVHLTVSSASETVFDAILSVRELAAGNAATVFTTQALNDAPVGKYMATATWRDASGNMLAAASREYRVVEDLSAALRGSVSVQYSELFRGESQICTNSIVNTGTLAAAVSLRRTLVNLDVPTTINEQISTVSIAPGETQTMVRGIGTTGFAAGNYACTLEAGIEGAWQPLGYATFRLLEPPIRISASMAPSEHGRLLVLLDPACADREPPAARGGACDFDPYGPDFAAPLPIQREHLEAVLTNAGWTYTIVTSAEDFEAEFESRGYELYALFNEQVKLPEALQGAVVADIKAGRGLLVAGSHDRRNGRLEEALGIKSLGKNLAVESLVVAPFGNYMGGEIPLDVAHWPNAIKLDGADVLGEFRLQARGKKTPAPEPAFTRYNFSQGIGLYAGFDWPPLSVPMGDDGQLATLLTASLDVAHPSPYGPVAGRVFPLQLTLQNEGMATPGEVRLALPSGTALVEGPAGAVVTDGVLAWPFALAEDQQLDFTLWLKLPETTGPLTLEAVVFAGEGDNRQEHARTQTVLNVLPEVQ